MTFRDDARAFGASLIITAMCGCSAAGTTPFTGVNTSSFQQPSTLGRPAKVPPVLAYIYDGGNYQTSVYAYPAYTLYQTLSFAASCADSAGNIWSVQSQKKVVEYAHGGTVPLRSLKVPLGYAGAFCAVSPSSGTLAVGTFIITGEAEDILLFPHANGKPTVIKGIYSIYFLGYDAHDNLFVDGLNSSKKFELFELPKGSKTIETISVAGATIAFPGSVQYTKNVLNIVDQKGAVNYQMRVNGTTATVTGSTPLTGSSDCAATYIYSNRLVCADAGNASVDVFPYPEGGKPVKVVAGFSLPLGVVVSAVPK
jgi:hypothetical protein